MRNPLITPTFLCLSGRLRYQKARKIARRMEAEVSLILDDTTTLFAFLVVKVQRELTFTFLDSDRQPIATDLVSQFCSVRLDESNPCKIILEGSDVTRCMIFQHERDVGKFYGVLQGKTELVVNERDPRAFTFVHAKRKPEIDALRFLGTIASAIGSQISGSGATLPRKRPVDGFAFGTIEQIWPSVRIKAFTRAEALATNDFSTISLPFLQFTDDSFAVMFEKIIEFPVDREECVALRGQWALTTPGQWDHDSKLRSFVHSLDKSLQISPFTTIAVRSLFFSTCMSLFSHRWGDLAFDETLVCLCTTVIRTWFNANLDGEGLTAQSGEALSREEAEVLAFSRLLKLEQLWRAKPINIAEESTAIRSLLNEISPSTLAMLDDRGLKVLDFFLSEGRIFFTRGRSAHDSILLVFCAFLEGDFAVFRKKMVAVILILLQSKLEDVPIKDLNRFAEAFVVELRHIPTRLLLMNLMKL
jgi:hypothetical protein